MWLASTAYIHGFTNQSTKFCLRTIINSWKNSLKPKISLKQNTCTTAIHGTHHLTSTLSRRLSTQAFLAYITVIHETQSKLSIKVFFEDKVADPLIKSILQQPHHHHYHRQCLPHQHHCPSLTSQFFLSSHIINNSQYKYL